jgi:hypothetical protein
VGRTVPTFVQLIENAGARWAKFRRALRREDQEHFDRLFRSVRAYTQAATYQCHDNPLEAILLCIALDLAKRVDALEHQGDKNHAARRLDSGYLSLPSGDDSVAPDPESDQTPPD